MRRRQRVNVHADSIHTVFRVFVFRHGEVGEVLKLVNRGHKRVEFGGTHPVLCAGCLVDCRGNARIRCHFGSVEQQLRPIVHRHPCVRNTRPIIGERNQRTGCWCRIQASTEPQLASLTNENGELKGQVTNLREDNGNLQLNVTSLNEQLVESDRIAKTPFVHGWVYTPDHGWLHIDPQNFPIIYKNDTQSWHFYEQGSINPRYFYNFTEQKWEAWDSIPSGSEN